MVDLILLNGAARSGKDTCASLMQKILKANGRDSHIIHFYDPLKGAVDGMFGFDQRHRDGSLKETPVMIRMNPDLMASAILKTLEHPDSPYKEFEDLSFTSHTLACDFIDLIQEDEFSSEVEGSSALISPRRLYQLYGTELMRQSFDNDIWINFAKKAYENAAKLNKVTIISDLRFDNEAEFGKMHSGLILKVINPEVTASQVSAHVSEAGISKEHLSGTIINSHSRGLDELEKLLVEVLDMYGVVSHFTRVVDFRKAEIGLLPISVICGRLNIARQCRAAIEDEMEKSIREGCHRAYYNQLHEDWVEADKIVKGLREEYLKRTKRIND
ncbi:deoxynucleotide monophosphate kinase [Erwinia phage Rouille]|uniref:Deoxynucleotide monophosphate kinase n=2 Tax=Kolesnikvirus TaxID=1985293 RepID=A0A5B9N548_9CAUD|nr:deoxynucleotide monophosphate kinase [Erwinia phage vB_Eam-MM7]QEG07632.1 deoxynucleotide monophosphate kinase [Salmonella phage SE5]UNA01038.1 deoxynucleotide monophosphate kinase [Erwinia phage Hena2]WJN64830.1 deoxynucleotide monophosphate kinase [Erwinia phage Rouille]WNA13671.1 putative deoxynucleoside-5'-monophosphate kinase [Erwinia phage FIfi106]AEJ81323.1 deoxynucleotide monophosphate kinase [Erwinia phage vB_Eam-MM7]